ncbi:hypothetical protein DM860_015999 [Cuscuta australis]|uniref:RNase H type-1 domain-containing protein n=1 Tax=Cuscuta australis TaxID=267555 RepID=A0A328DIK2_9ASTE|nr:hypothetical protein DM860_015999 [Cuscuta australis]
MRENPKLTNAFKASKDSSSEKSSESSDDSSDSSSSEESNDEEDEEKKMRMKYTDFFKWKKYVKRKEIYSKPKKKRHKPRQFGLHLLSDGSTQRVHLFLNGFLAHSHCSIPAIWKACNDIIWRHQSPSPTSSWHAAWYLFFEWQNATTVNPDPSLGPRSWTKPPLDWVKLKVDALVGLPGNRIGVGWIVRDHHGTFLATKNITISSYTHLTKQRHWQSKKLLAGSKRLLGQRSLSNKTVLQSSKPFNNRLSMIFFLYLIFS